MQSKRFTLNKQDLTSVITNMAIVAAGAVIAYLVETVPGIDFGANDQFIQFGIIAALKIGQKLVTGK